MNRGFLFASTLTLLGEGALDLGDRLRSMLYESSPAGS